MVSVGLNKHINSKNDYPVRVLREREIRDVVSSSQRANAGGYVGRGSLVWAIQVRSLFPITNSGTTAEDSFKREQGVALVPLPGNKVHTSSVAPLLQA